MVKCDNCGINVEGSFDTCPNCGSSIIDSEQKTDAQLKCSNCGALIAKNAEFCSQCGTKIENASSNRCEGCGSEVPEGMVFCPACGSKVKQPEMQKQVTICRSCGFQIGEDVTFCPECGTNIMTGEKPEIKNQNLGFIDKIDITKLIKPSIVSLAVAIVLSIIGVLIGLSWISFILAVIISVGFFAGLIDNEANALVSGLFVGLILGILENPIIEFCWGPLAALFYDWVFGGQILVLIILGMIIGYLSNVYLKDNIRNLVGNFADKL